jgi:hypothetical protein
MAETSATIIELSSYRATRGRIALRGQRRKSPNSELDTTPLGFYFFWPVFAWIPMASLLAPAATEEYT